MTRLPLALPALLVALSVTALSAQQAPAPPAAPAPAEAPAAPQPPDAPDAPEPELPPAPELPPGPRPPAIPDRDIFDARGDRDALRIGQDLTIAAGDAVREAQVILGDATIAGQIDNDLVVVLGSVRLTGTALVGGEVIAIGGNMTIEPGADIRRGLVVVGGDVQAPPDFSPGGEQIILGTGILGEWAQDLAPYITRGLLWGRLIVPDISWVWSVVAMFFLAYLALNVLFESPVRACAKTLAVKPMTAFGVGLLVLLLVGPVILLLAASMIGLIVVPFVFFGLVGAWILGKVAVARWVGASVVPEDEGNRAHATRSFVIGFVLITLAYMMPVIGLVTWGVVGVLGLGAATLAFTSAYRRENPRAVAPPPPVPAPAPAHVVAPTPPPAPTAPPPPVPATYSVPDDRASAAPAGEVRAPSSVAPATAADAPPAMAFGSTASTESTAPPDIPLPSQGGAAAIPLEPPPSALLAMPRAAFRDRLAAVVIDVVLVALVAQTFDIEDVFVPFMLIYHIGFWTWKQTTVGGMIAQVRIVRTDGAPLSFADALVRGLASVFSAVVVLIGFLWMLRDPDRQTWHDKIAGTYVVKVPRDWRF